LEDLNIFFLFNLVVFLELFGLFFLLVKLTIVPLVELIQRRFFLNKDWSVKNNGEQVQLARFVQLPVGEAQKKWELMKKRTENDSDVSVQTSF
jgi:hypothetical protein